MLNIKSGDGVGKVYKHLGRYRQIITIFVKHGFGNIIDILKVDSYFETGLHFFAGKKRERVNKLTRAERARLLLEELGPAFVKLGQILSTRPDIVPIHFIKEFEKLQDNVSPFLGLDVDKIVEMGFYPKVSPFDYIADTPFASASIGQVYLARLKNGENVAVKIQRPCIKEIIDVDLEIMSHLAILAERHIKNLAFFRPVEVVEEFAVSIARELDYTLEAVSMQKVAQQYLFDSTIYVPRVFLDKTTSTILTMEYVDGMKISEIDKLDENGYDRKLLVKRGADFILKQVFEHGFFHADLHPGNFFVLQGNVLCLIDFGMMGHIQQQTREDFIDLVVSVVTHNTKAACHFVLKLTEYENEPDLEKLERDLSKFTNKHLNKVLKEINLGQLFRDFLNIASKHKLRIYPETFIMMKTFVSVEGVALLLDPEFNIMNHVTPFIKKTKASRFSQKRVAEDINKFFFASLKFLQEFPSESNTIAKQFRKNKTVTSFDLQKQNRIIRVYQQAGNKIIVSVIIAALIIGSALILSF